MKYSNYSGLRNHLVDSKYLCSIANYNLWTFILLPYTSFATASLSKVNIFLWETNQQRLIEVE